jgi:hypothetical protein
MYYQNIMGFASPTANIAVNRNRLKSYGEKIYLKSGTHFEIELFNPKTTKVLAMIFLDGVAISSAGIVIKPGQRVFLERWIDEPKKFLFETYEVDTPGFHLTPEIANAIKENGKVKVEFYDQLTPPSNLNFMPTSTLTYTADYSSQPIYGGTTQNQVYFTSSIGGSSDIIGQNSSITTSSVTLDSFETGRAEKGEGSNQGFANDDSSYNSWKSVTVNMQILPESQKPVEVAEIRNYCTNCGTRHKKSSWKFCPNCGTKI